MSVNFKNRTKNRQLLDSVQFSGQFLFVVCLLSAFLLKTAIAGDKLSLENLNVTKALQTRAPSNYIPSEEIEPIPFAQELWIQEKMVEDDAGVLQGVKRQIASWEQTEEFADDWNLKSTGRYETPSLESKKNYLAKNSLKYFDKRLSGEMKRAEEGSTLAKVGQVQKALKPQTKVEFSKNVKLRFKARVLQGKAVVKLVNPYIDSECNVKVSGGMDCKVEKDFKDAGVKTKAEYVISEGRWIASVDKKISDHWSSRVSSHQSDDTMAFDDEADKRVELFYNLPF